MQEADETSFMHVDTRVNCPNCSLCLTTSIGVIMASCATVATAPEKAEATYPCDPQLEVRKPSQVSPQGLPSSQKEVNMLGAGSCPLEQRGTQGWDVTGWWPG